MQFKRYSRNLFSGLSPSSNHCGNRQPAGSGHHAAGHVNHPSYDGQIFREIEALVIVHGILQNTV